MDTDTPFAITLDLVVPWGVEGLRFDAEVHWLDIEVDFMKGSEFPWLDLDDVPA